MSKLVFGRTTITNPHASEDNPQRSGVYVETVRRTGRLNAGVHYRVTDGEGEFWTVPSWTAIVESEEAHE